MQAMQQELDFSDYASLPEIQPDLPFCPEHSSPY